jgi:hypothetical protein
MRCNNTIEFEAFFYKHLDKCRKLWIAAAPRPPCPLVRVIATIRGRFRRCRPGAFRHAAIQASGLES